MNLESLVHDIGDALVRIDTSRQAFRAFQPGVGPYGEPQLVRLIAGCLNELPQFHGTVQTKRTPDLLVPGVWAVEFKITRPYGEAENWSVNLLHPYPGNISTIGDCCKLAKLKIPERKAVVVIGYEHNPATIDLTPLVDAFELVAREVVGIRLSERIEYRHVGLVHPVHQVLRVFGWEVIEI